MNLHSSIFVLAFALLLSLQANAGDVTTTTSTFQGQITGVSCGACKEHVVTTLTKLKGVKDIEISPTNLPDVRVITIKAETASLTAEQVNTALAADHGEDYKVTTLAKKG